MTPPPITIEFLRGVLGDPVLAAPEDLDRVRRLASKGITTPLVLDELAPTPSIIRAYAREHWDQLPMKARISNMAYRAGFEDPDTFAAAVRERQSIRLASEAPPHFIFGGRASLDRRTGRTTRNILRALVRIEMRGGLCEILKGGVVVMARTRREGQRVIDRTMYLGSIALGAALQGSTLYAVGVGECETEANPWTQRFTISTPFTPVGPGFLEMAIVIDETRPLANAGVWP